MEVESGPGDYYLSRWNLKFIDNGCQIILVGFDGSQRQGTGHFSSLFKEGLEKYCAGLPDEHKKRAIHKMIQYHEVFTTEGSEHYHLSSAISNIFFKLDNLSNMFVISYPSVAKKKEDLNFAFKGKFAEDPKYLTFESIVKISINEFNKNGVTCSISRKGISVDSKIIWHQLEREVYGSILGKVTIEFMDGEKRTGVNTEQILIIQESQKMVLSEILQSEIIPSALPELEKYSLIGDYLKDNSLMYKTEVLVPFEVDPDSLFEFEGKVRGIKLLQIPIIYIDRFLPEHQS